MLASKYLEYMTDYVNAIARLLKVSTREHASVEPASATLVVAGTVTGFYSTALISINYWFGFMIDTCFKR